jgi:hypothetical protein
MTQQTPKIPTNRPNRQKRRNDNSLRQMLIFLSTMSMGCLCALLVGLSIAWYIAPTRYVDNEISQLPEEYADEVVIMAAADYALNKDIGRAEDILSQLNVANPAQYVSLVAERLIRRHRGPVTEEIQNVVLLADALNVSTSAMIAYVSSPTPTSTSTPLPTETPTPTLTPTPTPVIPTDTPTVESVAESESQSEDCDNEDCATVEQTEQTLAQSEDCDNEDCATIDTPEPEPTETPISAPPTDTPIPLPPTETPTLEPTPMPESEFDFRITEQRILTKDENGGCAGMHSIFMLVIDANGNPLRGVQIFDTWGNPGPVTGHKGDAEPGVAVWDLHKNGHYLFVESDPSAGRKVTSEVSRLLSSNDWEVGIPTLIEGGYCPDEGTCKVLWNSGVFGEGHNSLCWGHYSWNVIFQRAW